MAKKYRTETESLDRIGHLRPDNMLLDIDKSCKI